MHRSSSLPFGKYIFVYGRQVSAAFFDALSLGISGRRITKREVAMENKKANKKKTGEPMSLKDKREQAIAGSKRIAEERAERRKLMGLDA